MPEKTWIVLRRRAGLSQFSCARAAGISRNRLCLAETGQIDLTPAQETEVLRAVSDHLRKKSQEFGQLAASGTTSATA
jgi:DNA-binding XRE family transcriptional regulator